MKLSTFVLACDKYQWIYSNFFYFADRNLPLNFTFFTEDISGERITPLGKKPWNERLKLALESFDTKDILFLQEDFLIKYVDTLALEEAHKFHIRKKAHITKLGTNHEFNIIPTGESICGLSVYLQSVEDEYLLSHQPVAIFNREFLLNTISDKTDNAAMHEWEGSRIMRSNGSTRVFCIGPKFNPNKSLIFEIEHGLRGGVLLPEAEKLINEGY